MADELVWMDEQLFKKRFEQAFVLKPDLTPAAFHSILRSNDFDEAASMLQVQALSTMDTINPRGSAPSSLDSRLQDQVLDTSRKPIEPPITSYSRISSLGERSRRYSFEVIKGNPATKFESKEKHRHMDKAAPLLQPGDDDTQSSDFIDCGESSEALESGRKQSQTTRQKKAPQKDETPTTVTKWIGRLAAGLFLRTLIVCDYEQALRDKAGRSAAAEENVSVEALIDITSHREAIRRAGWTGRDVTKRVNMVGAPVWQKAGKAGYRSAVVDGVTINLGDFVTVRPGVDENNPANKNKRGETLTPAASIWFAQIVSLFEDDEGSQAHMHWLLHGGDTVLGETAGPRELFATDLCDDSPLGSVAGRIEVRFTGRDSSTESSSAEVHELNYNAVNQYFYRLSYSEAHQSFVEAQDLTSFMQNDTNHCKCCEIRAEKAFRMGIFIAERPQDGEVDRVLDSVKYKGVTYAINDFVYLVPERRDEVYTIVQIEEIQRKGLNNWVRATKSRRTADVIMKGQVFKRYDKLLDPYLREFEHGDCHAQRDCRRLYKDNSKSVKFHLGDLDGKCIVQHRDVIDNLEEYKDLDDTFYIEDQMVGCAKRFANNGRRLLAELERLDVHDLRQPADSDLQLAIEMSRTHAFMIEGQRLRAMEVFSGCGGLTAGLEQGGAITTEWAIEWDTAAARTFKRNFPSTKVYNHDANVMLQQAIEEHLETSQPLKDRAGERLCAMPKPGDVDFIYGGCPCQDFSFCNQYQKANSLKNSLIANFLSYVDHYRPKYFLLENVAALLHHRLGATQVNIHKVKGGIEMGSAKFIIRALTSLGYQVQFSVLQAGEYGTPQSRKRVFFWGSAPGYPLPKYPEPTHIFPAAAPKLTRRCAPHASVNVGDALSDLPAFDWAIRLLEGETDTERVARERQLLHRTSQIEQIPVVIGKNARIGTDQPRYASGTPNSEFQRQVRRDVKTKSVENAYTCSWGNDALSRVLRVPMYPGANHNNIDAKHDLGCLRSESGAAPRHKFYPDRYARLDYEKQFQTCLTDINPSGKNGKVLHPSQHRVLTVREQARSMGFPDTFTWDHDTQSLKDMYRQIGNAVAVPVGRALGRELLKVVIKKWEEEKQAVSGQDGDEEQVWELSDNTEDGSDESQSMNTEVPDLMEDVMGLDRLRPAAESYTSSRTLRNIYSESSDGDWMRID